MKFLHYCQNLFYLLCFPIFVLFSAFSCLCLLPFTYVVELHYAVYNHLVGIFSLLFYRRGHIHKTSWPVCAVVFSVIPYHAVILLNIACVVNIVETILFKDNEDSKGGIGIWNLGQSCPI